MTQALTRKALLRGRLKTINSPMRPPWSLDGPAFAAACTPDCDGECVAACPEGILAHGPDRRPLVRFGSGECTFCGACAEVCPTGALARHDADGTPRAPWSIYAEVTNRCLSIAGVTCRSCGDVCGEDAIDFKLGLNGTALPIVNQATCTGCGACVRPCPVGAISMTHPEPEHMT